MVGKWTARVLMGACLVLEPAVASAAEFQLVDDLSTASSQVLDNTPPCTVNAGGNAAVFDSAGAAVFQIGSGANVQGTAADCNETGTGVVNGHGLFALAPTVENPGDPVTVCLSVTLLNVAAARDNAAAEIDQDPVLLLAKSGTSSRVLIRLPADHFSAIGKIGEKEVVDVSEFQCGREVTMAVGDQLEGFLGSTSKSRVFGVGRAETDAIYNVTAVADACESAEFTECPADSTSAPAISPLPLAALACLMLLSGVAVRRRFTRRLQ